MKNHSTPHGGWIMAASLVLAGGCDTTSPAETPAKASLFLRPAGAFLVLDSPFNQIAFDTQVVGTAGAPRTVALRNDGRAALTIGTVGVTGGHASDFALGPNTTCSGATLAAGAECRLEVAFTPGDTERRTATLEIANDAAGHTHEIPLVGRGRLASGFAPTAGPIDPRHGFPAWYQDGSGVRLEPCVESATLCTSSLPDLHEAPSVTRAMINFPDEAAYWVAETEIRPSGRIRARLVLALEAGFGGVGRASVGEQIVFGRVRLRLEGVTPSVPYTFTHPFGTSTVSAGADGKIDLTEDLGCGSGPCDFRQALQSPVTQGFLKWDPAFAPPAPDGYLGDPTVGHRIVGSPTGNNVFRVEGSGVGGTGVFTIETNLFELAGKLLP